MKSILLLFVFTALAVWGQTIAPTFPPVFTLDEGAKHRLVEKALTLKAGDSFQTITNTLGRPSRDQKFPDPAGPISRILRYDILTWYTNASHPWDQYIEIPLRQGERLEDVRINVILK